MKIITTAELNELAENPVSFIASSEAAYSATILSAATQIAKNAAEKPIVLLSGPSGSGKTTTALRIEALLDSWGMETHAISMDNYYYRRADGVVPLDEHGKIDFESPECIDMELMTRHLKMIARCERIDVPTFDFVNQRRGEQSTPLHRKKNEIVILEGIHALNPQVTGNALDFSTGLYISVRTRIQGGNVLLHPEKLRLMRRLMRDETGRGQSYEDTISRLKSVSRGEKLYIAPYKLRADISLDTFVPYEASIYCEILQRGLKKISPEFLDAMDASEMLPMLRELNGIDAKFVPKAALIREFIGGLKL